MKSRVSLMLIMMLILMMVVGCGNQGESELGKNEEAAANQENIKEISSFSEVGVGTAEAVKINVAAPNGTPTLSMIKMFKEKPSLGENIEVIYESVKSPDLMASKVMSKEADIAIVPTNLAIKLYNKGVDYKFAASGIWGVLYIVSSEELTGWEDLRDKEINMIGRGLTPDVVLRALMKENGLEPDKDVKFKYVNGSTELAQLFIAGKSTVSIMPEPVLSKVLTKKEGTKIVLDLQKEWAKISKGNDSYPQAGVVINNNLVEKHPEIVEAFLEKYEESIQWVNENPTKAGEYSEELKTGLNAKIVEKAVTRSNLIYKNASDSKEHLEAYYKTLFGFSPELIGGKLPDEGFYLKK